ncbi:NADH:flavin oxidoreductase [Terricaulis silvestris]|uniref:NADPH dehydrogenase n=1 Tax=Terricaulis silvestris TaxID=2686094 RepID=A0A6I6MLR2_9CAUL|nr:NADH:flavin oxidoreductase [Terricaulis silvestris]QGZ94228.1 NADPH dehydrogenase [Terricaulis silvestris]
MAQLTDPLQLRSGATLKNRFILSPLTNLQSHADGVLSDDEFRWLTMRAEGGFALTMTCAASVQESGVGFPGQLGFHDEKHLQGITRLARTIKEHVSHAVAQLHHGGLRAMKGHKAPSADEKLNAEAMTLDEVRASRDHFIAAAQRAERAGFDGVELHGAHGYLICSFLSPELNRREDEYGGSPENRARFLNECIDGVRAATKSGFSLGVRLSPERWGIQLPEIRDLAQRLMREAKIDYIDMSLWDVRKEPNDEAYQGRTLASYFTELDRNGTRLGAAGKIMSAQDARDVIAMGFDFPVLGRAAILHHDFPKRAASDANFTAIATPVSEAYLHEEGLGPAFVQYMRTWKGFVEEPAA